MGLGKEVLAGDVGRFQIEVKARVQDLVGFCRDFSN